jgi:hypothetical protein
MEKQRRGAGGGGESDKWAQAVSERKERGRENEPARGKLGCGGGELGCWAARVRRKGRGGVGPVGRTGELGRKGGCEGVWGFSLF